MGCCISTSRHANDASPRYDAGSAVPDTENPSTSRVLTRGSGSSLRRTGTAPTAHSGTSGEGRAEEHGAAAASSSPPPPSQSQQQQQQQPLSLRLPPRNRCRTPKDTGVWSAARLQSERTAFWETRVSGRSEVWQGLRLVCELLQSGELVEARAVLDAAGCVCPSGALWKYVYDEFGERYDVPAWLIGDPPGLVLPQQNEGAAAAAVGYESEEDGDEDGGSGEKVVSLGRSGEKGKGRAADVGELVKVRARLSDRATDVVVRVGQKEFVRVLARRVEEQAGISKPGRVKIVYLGKVLNEHETLLNQHWREGHVVNALVFM